MYYACKRLNFWGYVMGFLALASLIPAFRGNVGTALCMLGADWLLSSQAKNNTPQVYTVKEDDGIPILTWALGKRFFDSLAKLIQEGKVSEEEFKEVIIQRWNKMRGTYLYLHEYESFENNFKRIAKKWVNRGCPGAY